MKWCSKKIKQLIENKAKKILLMNQTVPLVKARLVELVDTSDLKSDSFESIGSIPVTSIKQRVVSFKIAKMMELVDMLGLGSSSFRVGVQVPFLVTIY